ncbi:MAG TPA: carbamoyltransferase C-terminal domain-containing protein [Vicinamibacterales bacterium]|nr:carbamoyltransferase C-terminal domain-containing protein [Vicinamibacterales bacterium]
MHETTFSTARISQQPPAARADRTTATVGISGSRRNAAAAVAVNGRLEAFCEQERVTRVRRIGLAPGQLPAEALGTALATAGVAASDIGTFAVAEPDAMLPDSVPILRQLHHRAHAATAWLTSPFDRAAILVCDRHRPQPVSVWVADSAGLVDLEWPWQGPGLADLYAECAAALGFAGREHQLETLARLSDGREADRFAPLLAYSDGCVRVDPRWPARVADWCAGAVDPERARARIAAAFQEHLARLLVALLADVKARVGVDHLCLTGGLFYNTRLNTAVAQSGLFARVHVPPNPGNAGLAAGLALAPSGDHTAATRARSPFLGPEYAPEAIKTVLDGCKISCECVDEDDAVAIAVDALARGLLVGWFQGRMEYGPRALGNRSILADPRWPYVLDNVNVYLKQRERYRPCALSVCVDDVHRYFDGPAESPYMEFEYSAATDLLRHAIPAGVRSMRVQTVEPSQARFHALHKAFAARTGIGVLVNTSFNGFSEPIVCSPRDAIRVFFGTGIDVLILDRFVVRK